MHFLNPTSPFKLNFISTLMDIITSKISLKNLNSEMLSEIHIYTGISDHG